MTPGSPMSMRRRTAQSGISSRPCLQGWPDKWRSWMLLARDQPALNCLLHGLEVGAGFVGQPAVRQLAADLLARAAVVEDWPALQLGLARLQSLMTATASGNLARRLPYL